jgi:hypothetical protein
MLFMRKEIKVGMITGNKTSQGDLDVWRFSNHISQRLCG